MFRLTDGRLQLLIITVYLSGYCTVSYASSLASQLEGWSDNELNPNSSYLVDRASFINSFYFFFQLDTLIFSFFTFTVFLYMFRTGWSIIRRIKCFITQAASGTVPSVVDVSCVAVGVRLSNWSGKW